MSAPTVMVSSTFYDLRQIRADLAQFLEDDLGYTALLSEFPSFPVDPDKDAVENCCKRVEENADILVLVVGGRYGSIDKKAEKSITNLEYLTARRKLIPIYAFVDKQILSVLPVWKKNPEGDYSNVVDTTKLFQFIEEVRTKEGVWTFPFETAQDIVTALRIQLAHLFNDSLLLRHRIAGVGFPTFFEGLSSVALRIALEKPKAWEYLLFFQVWLDEVKRHSKLITEYEAGLRIGTSVTVEVEDATSWIHTRLSELEGLITSANHLLNISAQQAFAKQGEPGDVESIIRSARSLGDILEASVNWTQLILRARVEEPFTSAVAEMASFPSSAIDRLRHFPVECITAIEKAVSEASPESPQELELVFVFELSNAEAYSEAMEEAGRRFEDGDF